MLHKIWLDNETFTRRILYHIVLVKDSSKSVRQQLKESNEIRLVDTKKIVSDNFFHNKFLSDMVPTGQNLATHFIMDAFA